MMTTALWCTCILGSLLFGLGLLISVGRYVTGNFYVGDADPTRFTTKLARAHGNTAEFAPVLAVLMMYLGTHQSPWWLQFAMIGATLSRILVVVGFLTSATLSKMSPIKAVGAVGTYGFGLALTTALLLPSQ